MQYVQVGEIGKAVLVPTKSDLPTAGIAYLNKFYVATDKNVVYTCKPEGSGYAWKVATILPALTNGIAAPIQLREGVEAIDANGNKVTGTMKLVEKIANANGTYLPSEDNAQGYSKFIVDVAGETAQNPYIATTEAEMKAYLSEEYVGSFVKYKTPLYFNQANSVPLHCSSLETTGAIDTGLGPEYVNMKIDEWLREPGMVKIASIETFNHDNTYMAASQPYSVRETFDLYAWKYKNTDGSYTRILFYAIAQIMAYVYNPDSSASWYDVGASGIVFYQDNITDEAKTALGQLSVSVTVGDYTGTTSVGVAPAEYKDYVKLDFFSYAEPNSNNYTDYIGKYASEDSSTNNPGIMGVAQLSWATNKSVYWNSITYPRCTYLYKDASVLLWCIQRDIPPNKPESEKTYRDGFVYIVNSKKATRNKWQAESPLVEGDQLAGATYYFNQQITHKEYADLCKQLIPSSERVDDDSDAYFFYNVDNPQPADSMSPSNIVSGLPLMDTDERYNILMSYLFYPSNVPHTPVNPINVGDTITSLEFATDITPDFTKFDWSQAEIIDGTGKVITLIEGTTPQYSNNDRLQVGMIPAGTVLEGHTFANDNYVITAGTGGEVVYLTEEYAQLLEYTPGWAKYSLSMDSTTVTSVSQQDIWGKYISKDGRWSTGESDNWTSVFLFGDTPADTTTITSASVVVPTSYTYADMIQTVPATLGKVNKPLITNGIIGKTPNFTKTTEEYSIYYFTQEVVPGNVFTVSNTAKMNALLGDETTNNEIAENRVYLFTGQDGTYVQGTFYQLSNGSLHILPPLDVEDTALIPVYFETQEGWYHSPKGTTVKQLIQLISRGMYAVCPEAPSVAKGKFFDAWYTQPTGGTEWNFSTAINKPTILYAQYIS